MRGLAETVFFFCCMVFLVFLLILTFAGLVDLVRYVYKIYDIDITGYLAGAMFLLVWIWSFITMRKNKQNK